MRSEYKTLIYDICYQYSHFFLTIYSIFLIFLSIFFFILGLYLGVIVNCVYFFLIGFMPFIFPYGLDMFSRSIYNYPFFEMDVLKTTKKFNLILHRYISFVLFFNSFILGVACVFGILSFVHLLLFYEILIGIKVFLMACILMITQIPVVLEMFYYGWANKSLYYNIELKIDFSIG